MKKPILRIIFLMWCGIAMSAVTFVDPTKPANYIAQGANGAGTEQSLSATFIYADRKLAIINGTLYKEGDHFGQFTIQSITPYSVVLVGPQHTKEILSLLNEIKIEKQ